MFTHFFRANPISAVRKLANEGRLPLAQYMRLSDVDTDGLRKRMLDAMARFSYVLEWANENEERQAAGKKYVRIPGGSRIEDYVPTKTPASARKYARELAADYEKMNGVRFEELFILAMAADPSVDIDDAEKFAQDLVWMAQGAGVSWFDDHKKFELQVPSRM